MKQIKDIQQFNRFMCFLDSVKGKNTRIINLLFLFLAISTFTACQKDDDNTDGEEETVPTVSFILTDTGQDIFYDADGNEISTRIEGDDYYGQDAQYTGVSSSFQDNSDGTVTDLNTGFMWQQTPDFERHNYYDAFDYVESLEIGGYTDWRLPTIKELYSLLNSNGELDATNTSSSQPYLYDEYFDFEYDVL